MRSVLLGPAGRIDDGLSPHHTLVHLLARPSFARKARSLRLLCPFVVMLLETWTLSVFNADQK